jgi:hypothetical protein
MELARFLVGGGDHRLLRSRLGKMSERRFLAELRTSVQAGPFENEYLSVTAVPDPRRARSENRIAYAVRAKPDSGLMRTSARTGGNPFIHAATTSVGA